jgi:hypothetical protein
LGGLARVVRAGQEAIMRWFLALRVWLGAWVWLGACVPVPHFDLRAPANVRRWLLGSLLGAVLFLGACVPWPHYSRHAPEVEGVVLRNGVPIEGVYFKFLLNIDPKIACSGDKLPFSFWPQTNAQGRFQGESVERLELFISIGYNKDVWSTCFFFPDGSSYYYSEYGPSVPLKQVWRCDVKSDEPTQGLQKLTNMRWDAPGEAGTCVVEDVW